MFGWIRRVELWITPVAFLVAVVAGCGDPIIPVPPETTFLWSEEEHSFDTPLEFTGICGVSENLIFAVGWAPSSDVMVKFEDNNWTYVIPPTDSPVWFSLTDIHLHPSGFGYAVSQETSYRYLYEEWSSGLSGGFTTVWVDGVWAGWAAGADGTIFNLEYYGWWDVWDFPGEEFTDICRVDDHGFIVGLNGVIVHTIGWSEAFEEDSGTPEDLHGVWGNTLDGVFAVGDNGTIVRFDGELWRPMDSGVSASLYGVWGTSSDNVFAVGEGGTVLHYDGTIWTPMNSNVKTTLRSVWGTSETDVLAVGARSTIIRYGLEQQE